MTERVVFADEISPGHSLRLVVSGEIDGALLEALDDFVRHQKERLAASPPTEPPAGEGVNE